MSKSPEKNNSGVHKAQKDGADKLEKEREVRTVSETSCPQNTGISKEELEALGIQMDEGDPCLNKTPADISGKTSSGKSKIYREPAEEISGEPERKSHKKAAGISEEELNELGIQLDEPVIPSKESPEISGEKNEEPVPEPESPGTEEGIPGEPSESPVPPAPLENLADIERRLEQIASEPDISETEGDEENYEATAAISREELIALGLKTESSPEYPEESLRPEELGGDQYADIEANYEATVAISREELSALGLKRNSPEQPEEFPPEEPPDFEANYEATVAISREELAALGLKRNASSEPPEESLPEGPSDFEENYEATVAISRQELAALGLKKESSPEYSEEPPDFERDYEATVAISRQELRELGLQAEAQAQEQEVPHPSEEHIETRPEPSEVPADTPKEKTESPKAAEPRDFEGDVSRGESDECIPEIKEEQIFNGNITISRGQLKVEADTCSEDYSASELEDEFYRRAVAKDHGHNKYKFIRKLVSGGMGSILKVQDQDLNRLSAMKVILPRFKSNEDTLCDFITEAKITGLLEHPNVIPVHELGLLRDTGLFFTMKLLGQGESLNDILTEIRRGNPEYVEKYNTYHLLNIFRKVCDAVSYSHSVNIVHRDIKPHNIMVGDYGEVLLMDWGIAQFVGNPEAEKDPVIREVRGDIERYTKGKKDMIKGSPTYMSPEQVIGEPHLLDKRSDIFLLGSTLYHMFTFEAPYFGKDIYEILRKAETGDLVPPQIRNPATQIPEEICRIIMKAMAHRKEDRYQTVEELANDIDDLISGKWSRQEKKVFQPGEMLMREGEEGEEAYLILSGEVQVVKESEGHKIVLATLKEGDVIGEMSLISKEKLTRSASVEALERTEAAVLTKHVISQNLKKLPPYMEKIVATLTDRLREANTKIHPHASGDCTHIILKQLRMVYKDRSSKKARNLGLPLKDLIEEISADLGLSRKKVEAVLSKALEVNLISAKKDKIYVPDMSELTHFSDSKKP